VCVHMAQRIHIMLQPHGSRARAHAVGDQRGASGAEAARSRAAAKQPEVRARLCPHAQRSLTGPDAVLNLLAHVTALRLQSARCMLARCSAWPGVRGLALHVRVRTPCRALSAVFALHGVYLSAVLSVHQGAPVRGRITLTLALTGAWAPGSSATWRRCWKRATTSTRWPTPSSRATPRCKKKP